MAFIPMKVQNVVNAFAEDVAAMTLTKGKIVVVFLGQQHVKHLVG